MLCSHTYNGLNMLLHVSVSVEQALTVKANVAIHHKRYQPVMIHLLLVHVLIAVYQKAMLPFS